LAFGNVPVNTTSAEKIYVLTGVNLGTNKITVTAPTGYTVSTISGTGFASSVSVTPSSGIVSQFIYVRFTPTAGQAFNGNITNANSGATTQNVALTGSGTIQTALGTIDDTKVNTNQLIVYPNSINGVFTVQSTREGVYSIIKSLGQTMQPVKLNSANQYRISIENLNSGIYFIVGFNNNQKTSQKVVVTK
jgi:hypothetical protein